MFQKQAIKPYLGLNFKITPNSKLYNSASIKGKRDIK